MKKFLLFFCLLSLEIFAQNNLPLGTWRDHLTYKKVIRVAVTSDKVYGLTESGYFTVSRSDNSVEKFSKVNGLSDVGASAMGYNSFNNTLIIGYKNGNLDIIKNNVVTNLSDIKRSTIIGNKSINHIYFINQYAYLSCGFGIVVLDTELNEVRDTYYIGANGSYTEVRGVTSDSNYLYAATNGRIYKASLSSPNLADFSSWIPQTSIPAGRYNSITTLNNKVYASLSKNEQNGAWDQDTIYVHEPSTNSWRYFAQPSGFIIRSMETSGNFLVISFPGYARLYDTNETIARHVYTYPHCACSPDPSHAVYDGTNMWIADITNGIVRTTEAWEPSDGFMPNGPETSKVYALDVKNGEVGSVPGGRSDIWGNVYFIDGFSILSNGTWNTINYNEYPFLGSSAYDLISVVLDKDDPARKYIGSLSGGLLEFYNNQYVQSFKSYNSTLNPRSPSVSDTGNIHVSSVAMDADKNLWMTNIALTGDLLHVKTASGQWYSFDCSAAINNVEIANLIIRKESSQKWAILPRGRGVLVYDDNGTISNDSDDKVKRLTFQAGMGGMSGTDVLALAEDREGEIWVGTDKGICVFYSPESVFNSSGFDAQQILLEQDGHFQYLLETQIVTAIAVDGANRKWIGTQSGGVFLMSADGTKQIEHFTEENSPLLSDNIATIAIDHNTGDVYFGTQKGLVSFRGSAIEGLEFNEDVYAYPNPVKPGYEGEIAIRGLVTDSDVKITDISGNLIYETKALGGQAIWNGKNFNGERARSGVYLVFCSNEDGKKTVITKIMVLN